MKFFKNLNTLGKSLVILILLSLTAYGSSIFIMWCFKTPSKITTKETKIDYKCIYDAKIENIDGKTYTLRFDSYKDDTLRIVYTEKDSSYVLVSNKRVIEKNVYRFDLIKYSCVEIVK